MDETDSLTLSATLLAEGGGFADPTAVFAQITFDPATAPSAVDPDTGEATYVIEDPEAALWIDGESYAISGGEIRVADNLNVGGVFLVDRILLTVEGDGPGGRAELTAGVGSFALGTLTGTGLPAAPLGPFDIANDFGTQFTLDGQAPEPPSPDVLRLEIGPVGYTLAADVGLGVDEAGARDVALLYEAALDRDGAIDTAGLNFWIDRVEDGLSERALARAFLASPEFEASFGDVDALTEEELVTRLYQNVLGRDPDADGFAFWVDVAQNPEFGADGLLLAFATSFENALGTPETETLVEVGPGVWDFL